MEEYSVANNDELITFKSFMQRLFEIVRDCGHEHYLCEIFIPFLKMCCIENTKLVPIFDDRATGPSTQNETDYKIRMKTICAKSDNNKNVVPDYIFVPSDYSFKNPKKPYLMVETKKPSFLNDGKYYADLENSIKKNENEIAAEITANNRNIVLYTDGITWMFLALKEGKIVKKYPTICLVDKYELYRKTKRIKLKKEIKPIDLRFMGEGVFYNETEPEEWKTLKEQIKSLLDEIISSERY